MTTKAQVLQLIEAGTTYREAGSRLGIPPGQAYLVATGIPCDGGDALAPEDTQRRGALPGSTQELCNPPQVNPTTHPEALVWAQRLARSDAHMRSAAATRSPDPGTIREDEERPDAVDVLRRRHNQVAALLRQLKWVPGVTKGADEAQQAARETVTDMVTVRLSAHEAAERRYFWPVVRRRLPNGAHLAHEAIAQEEQATEVLQRISSVPASEPEFDELVQKLGRLTSVHVAFEDQVFLDVRAAVPERELGRLGARLVEAHDLSPSPPRPGRQPAEVAARPTAGTGDGDGRGGAGAGSANGGARRTN